MANHTVYDVAKKVLSGYFVASYEVPQGATIIERLPNKVSQTLYLYPSFGFDSVLTVVCGGAGELMFVFADLAAHCQANVRVFETSTGQVLAHLSPNANTPVFFLQLAEAVLTKAKQSAIEVPDEPKAWEPLKKLLALSNAKDQEIRSLYMAASIEIRLNPPLSKLYVPIQ